MDAYAPVVFALALLVAAGSPGPSVVAPVARTLVRGWRDVLPFVLAIWVGEAVWLAAAGAGLATVAERFHLVFVVSKYAGIAYLLYLARQMWTAPVHEGEPTVTPRGGAPRMFGAGLAVTLGNRNIMVFDVAPLPAIVPLPPVTLAGWATLTLTMLAVLAFVDVAWMAMAAWARLLLASPGARRLRDGQCRGGDRRALAEPRVAHRAAVLRRSVVCHGAGRRWRPASGRQRARRRPAPARAPVCPPGLLGYHRRPGQPPGGRVFGETALNARYHRP